jgi:putative peptidoglycan lipid II flippase
MDSNSTILKSAARFFSGTLLSRFTGLVRDIAMAYSFGTAAPLAAFFTAFRLSQVPRRLLGEGGMQTAFIPHFEELKGQSEERALAFFRDMNAFLSALLLGIVCVVMSGLGLTLALFELSPGSREIVYLTFLMMPGLFFICLYGLNSGLLECQGSYFTPSAAPIAFNLVWIGAALLLAGMAPAQAMPYLAFAITLACFGQWAMTLPRTVSFLGGYRSLAKFNLRSSDLKTLIKPLFLANLGVLATQINSALDPLFARWAHPEGPAWLWYAIRIEQLPLALFGIALSGALLPPLTRAIKNNDYEKFHSFLQAALKKSAWLMIPLTLGMFLLGRWGITVLFARGDFQAESVHGTTLCLWGYAIGLLPQTYVLITASAFFAMKDYKTPAAASLLAVICNSAMNALFIFGLHWGPESVAVATSLASWVNYLFLRWKLPSLAPAQLKS